MALNIKSREADRLARELAALTGESITDAVTKAVEDRLARERGLRETTREGRRRKLDEIADRMAAYPVLDGRPMDELLGYNEIGTFD